MREATKPLDILLVLDAMTGQDAVNVAESFSEVADFDGVLITKLDGDARGGAALSVRAVTGKPIKPLRSRIIIERSLWRSARTRRRLGCALRPASPAFGATKASARKLATSSRWAMAASPKASPRRSCWTPRRCSKSWPDAVHLLRGGIAARRRRGAECEDGMRLPRPAPHAVGMSATNGH